MDMIRQAVEWIAYLQSAYGLRATVHARDRRLTALVRRYPQINIHSSGSCIYIKSVPEMWDICIHHQEKIYDRIRENGGEPFFGTCYAGIGEYIFPICEGNIVCGFISVGQFCGCEEKMRHAAEKYCLDAERLKKLREEHLIATPSDAEQLALLTAPLCAMLLLGLQTIPDSSADDSVARLALSYLHRHYATAFRLCDVAACCNCSVRTLSSTFRRVTGTTPVAYAEDLRMEKAKKLLSETDFSITEVACFCGYENSNYFTRRFSARFGLSPTEYRKTQKKTGRSALTDPRPRVPKQDRTK